MLGGEKFTVILVYNQAVQMLREVQ
jgi:hypothetical protein